MAAKCECLNCPRPQGGEVLQFRPPGHARHEGTFTYRFCVEHTDAHRNEPGYTVVEWDAKALRFVPKFCRCSECAEVHADFLGAFGRWPDMSHADAMKMRERRIENVASWDRAMSRLGRPR